MLLQDIRSFMMEAIVQQEAAALLEDSVNLIETFTKTVGILTVGDVQQWKTEDIDVLSLSTSFFSIE